VIIFGTLTGTIVSILSIGFVLGVKNISDLRIETSPCLFQVSGYCFSITPLVFLFLAAIIIILVKRSLNISRYHGPADVILSAHSPSTELDVKTGFLSTFSAFISASGGASVGQYGPLVHLGGTIGNFINRQVPALLSKDIFIGCGVAAAISAGFNSPIGGIIFAHEAILRHFSFRAIAPIALSSVVSSTLTTYFFPSGILFQNTDSDISLLPAVSLSLLLGPICALIAVIFMKSLLSLQRNIIKISPSEISRILIAVLICGLLGGFIPEILGLGGETISGILNKTYSINFIILLLILKLMVTVVCLSMGFFGGVFSPALVLGASVGGIFTYIGNLIGIGMLGSSLILAGMAALSASVIGAPIATIVIIFELTHSYDLAFVSIICVAGSCLISSFYFGHSFFDKQLLSRNFKISRGRTEILLSEISVENLLHKNEYLAVSINIERSKLLDLFETTGFTEAYFIDDDGKLVGKTKVNSVLSVSTSNLIQENNPLFIKESSNISDAIIKVSNFVGESIPVTDNNGRLKGVVTESDLFLEYLKVQEQISEIEKD
jgi:CIC family chloride channel protein